MVKVQRQYDEAERFSEGLAPVKMDGKWGFIDKNGVMIIQPKYDYVAGFSNGLSLVGIKNWGKLGYINKDGVEVYSWQYH